MTQTLRPISQRKVLGLLMSGQILSGLGVGITVAAGTIIITNITGNESWSGFAVTVAAIGAAISSIPLARMAARFGRRISLSIGMFVAALGATLGIYATAVGNIWLVLTAFFLLGTAQATSLQARFAATDLSLAQHRGRDLSIITWSTVIGSVAGPNMLNVGMEMGHHFGLPGMAGVFIPPLFGQVSSALIFFFLMRPDPLLQAKREWSRDTSPEILTTGPIDLPAQDLVVREEPSETSPHTEVHTSPANFVGNAQLVILAITAIALSQWVMTSLMSMTPVHIDHHGGDITLVGITISLHIAGMYGISPLFGILTDRFGALNIIFLGQLQLVASALIIIMWSESQILVTVALILLGTGWSAGTVAGSAMLNQYAPSNKRVVLQGRGDSLMNLAGAFGAATAGPIMTFVGYEGLAWVMMAPIAIMAFLGIRAIRIHREAPIAT